MLSDDEWAAYVAAQAKRKGRMPADDEMMFAAGIAYAQTEAAAELARLTAEVERLRADADLALDLLAVTFDAIENGDPCYENPDETDGYMGNAVHLADDTFIACADLLNRTRPKLLPNEAIKEAGNG